MVWRSVWGEIRRPASEGQLLVAVASATLRRYWTPERDRRAPARFEKTGVPGLESICESHARSCSAVVFQSGMTRSLRPLPWRWSAEARLVRTSVTHSPVISETRAPVL